MLFQVVTLGGLFLLLSSQSSSLLRVTDDLAAIIFLLRFTQKLSLRIQIPLYQRILSYPITFRSIQNWRFIITSYPS